MCDLSHIWTHASVIVFVALSNNDGCFAHRDYSNCWTFRTDPGYYLAVKTAAGFDVEGCPNCYCDSLKVYCGDSKCMLKTWRSEFDVKGLE